MAKRSIDTILNLPDVKRQNLKLAALIREGHSLIEAEKRLKAVRKEIADIITTQGLAGEDGQLGARIGHQGAIVRWAEGRFTFDKEKAIDAGVTPQQIDASMKQGAGYWVVELPRMD